MNQSQAVAADVKSTVKVKAAPPPPSAKRTRRIKIAERYGWKCYWCSQKLRKEFGWQNSATIEHITPRSLGGSNEFWNLASACYRCNLNRGLMCAEQFAMIARDYVADTQLVEHVIKARKKQIRRDNEQKRLALKALRLQGLEDLPPPTPAPTVTLRVKTWLSRISDQIGMLLCNSMGRNQPC